MNCGQDGKQIYYSFADIFYLSVHQSRCNTKKKTITIWLKISDVTDKILMKQYNINCLLYYKKN